MGKNTLGGNKQKSKKNRAPRQKSVPINEITPDNKTKFVAQVTKTLGSYRVDVEAYPTNDSYNALIPGSFRNRIWINTGDYVLIEVSADIGGNNCFIIHKYDGNEIDELIELGHFAIKSKDDGDGTFQFVDDDEEVDLNAL
jgi:initiation factor 1A